MIEAAISCLLIFCGLIYVAKRLADTAVLVPDTAEQYQEDTEEILLLEEISIQPV